MNTDLCPILLGRSLNLFAAALNTQNLGRLHVLVMNAKRAQRRYDREQEKGITDMSVKQTRRMAFASRGLQMALSAVTRERISLRLRRTT